MFKILRSNKGEGYIDVAILILCVMLIIALAVKVFPVYILKQQIDTFATELVREAEIAGRVGTETTNRETLLRDKMGSSFPLIIAVTLALIIIFTGISEYFRLMIIAQGVRDAVQDAVISTVNDNYDDV